MIKPYMIAEFGVNFYDSAKVLKITPLQAAKLYIEEAARAGVNCVKFQSYKANTIVSKKSPAYWDTSKETSKTQYELFSKYDHFGEEEYRQLSRYAHEKGLDFTSTPFDYHAVDYLFELVDFYKISSSDLNNLPFIRYIAKKGKPIVMSVGAAYLSEVEEAIREVRNVSKAELVIMHCMLSYPTKPKDANLQVITTLQRVFDQVSVGYSDHVAPDEAMTTITTAYILGAKVIEKHFTLDKTLPGNDHYHAGDPKDFIKAIQQCELVNQLLGSKEKTVFACEEVPRKEARRSLVLTRSLKAGERICNEDIAAKRPGTGIAPSLSRYVIGRKVTRDLAEDTVLTWDVI